MTVQCDFRGMGFFAAFPGREYRLTDGSNGALGLQIVALRMLTDDLVKAANLEGLRLVAAFDDAHPDFVLIETSGLDANIMALASVLDALRYHRTDKPTEAPATLHHPSGPPHVDLDSLPDPMTDDDIVKFMRWRTKAAVQQMRLTGGLPFTPGRPPTVTKADLIAYLERIKIRSEVKERRPLAAETRQADRDQANADARAWAIKMLNRPARAPRGKSAKPTE